MVMSKEMNLCPCIRSMKSPTDGSIIQRADDNCSICNGMGYAEFVTFTNPQNIERISK